MRARSRTCWRAARRRRERSPRASLPTFASGWRWQDPADERSSAASFTPVKRKLTAVIAALAVAAFAASAQAAIPIQNVVAEPTDTTERTEPTAFHIHFELGGSEHIKDLTQQLPYGLETQQFHPACSEATFLADGCPENTQIGTSSVNLTAGIVPQDVSGRIFFLA